MRERELATLLIEIGLQSGVSIDRVVDELGSMSTPSFVSQQTFRGALADAAEAHLRRQFEDQLSRLRQKIGANRPVVGRVQVAAEPDVQPFANEPFANEPIAPLKAAEPPPPAPAAPPAVEEELPADATLVWTTQHGQRSGS
jgi:hypothetical protein